MTVTSSRLFKGGRHSARQAALLADGVRLSAEYLARVSEKPDPRRMRLAASIGSLFEAKAAASADPFDALLRTGNRALEAGGENELRLALALAETATEIRSRSKGAWRLRGLALEALGRDEDAISAYERHLDLQQSADASHDVALRLGRLREMQACLHEAARLFPGESPFTVGKRSPAQSSAAQVKAVFTAYVQQRMGERGTGDPEVRRLVELYATYRRLTARRRMADPLLGGSEPLGAGDFRNLIADRTVCLVANAAPVDNSTLGDEIDSYDLVIRCDAFRTCEAGTGERTDVHAVSLRGESPWEGPRWSQPVEIRLVFAESVPVWRQAIRRRLVPAAQAYVGNAALRRPVSDPGLLGEGHDRDASTGYTVLRLLDFLDVNPRIDLFGFGLPGQLRPQEREWLLANAKDVDRTAVESGAQTRIALR
jgi:tetratricopeptide (TPR) repeat protein